ncbi:MAG: MgtC/SapB family protein [Candidatus Omnitrophica bacterium]|jgi:putative Mg2+ transporter-C (MgtC) family protein|nr:MgtC/SapB family protein [Candidatus Omnitrophota bacterium]
MLDLKITIIRIVLAALLGGLIGLEREKKGRNAGLRTHILVCTGSSLIMLVSLYVFEMYQGKVPVDPSRIAAGVVTGIGFLGAGTIMASAEGVKGLTTAASIWVSSAIGLAVGCGFTSAAVVATIVTFATLAFLKHIEKKLEVTEKTDKS